MKDKYSYTHMRQSDQWFHFWELMGWNRVVFDKSLSMRVSKNVLGSTLIIEKPGEISEDMLDEIEKYAKENKAGSLYIKPGLSQSSDSLDTHYYSYAKGSSDITKTGIINLSTPPEVLYKNFSYRVRHLIKTSGNNTRLSITGDYTNSEVEEFYSTYKQIGRSKGFFTYSKDAFSYFMESFKGNAYLCIVRNKNNEYLGGCVFACEGKTAWYMFSIMNEKGREYDIGYAMIGKGIDFLMSRGYKFLDLEGLRDERYEKTNSSQSGYGSFKEHFHPDIVYYPKVRVKYFSKLHKLLDLA